MMTTAKTSFYHLKFLGILCAAAIGLLTACGERGPSESPLGSAMGKGAKASAAAQCFYAVGRPSKNDVDLFAASGAGDVRRVEQAIDAGGNLNATDSLKRTPLFAAAFCNHSEVANLLIDKGGDVNARDFLGMSPLHAAVVAGGDEAAKTLISKGANINIQSTAGRTPLHLAAATNQLALVELLLERGADAQIPDKNGITAASLASSNDHPTIGVAIEKWQEKHKPSTQKGVVE
jgi:ankyrin repeat protein